MLRTPLFYAFINKLELEHMLQAWPRASLRHPDFGPRQCRHFASQLKILSCCRYCHSCTACSELSNLRPAMQLFASSPYAITAVLNAAMIECRMLFGTGELMTIDGAHRWNWSQMHRQVLGMNLAHMPNQPNAWIEQCVISVGSFINGPRKRCRSLGDLNHGTSISYQHSRECDQGHGVVQGVKVGGKKNNKILPKKRAEQENPMCSHRASTNL